MSLAFFKSSPQPICPVPAKDWIAIHEASRRSGESEGTIRRKCGKQWLSIGMARLEYPPGGGKPIWMVSVNADPAFAATKFPEQIEFDDRVLSADQRRELHLRKEILDQWKIARAGGTALGFTSEQVTEQFVQRLDCERDIKLAGRTLYLWESAFRADGLAGLVDRRWMKSRNGASAGEGNEFHETLKGFFLTRRRLSKRTCWEMTMAKAEDNGWRTIEYRAACLYLDKIPEAVRIKNREGNDAYTARCEPSIERDYSTLHSNEQWVGDHHQFDVICNANGVLCRAWLTAWMDMRSRLPVGWCIYAHDPNSNSILSALRSGILEHGVPEMVYVDNGKDFGSYVFHGSTKMQRRQGKVQLECNRITGVLNRLDIKSRFCWAYHGQSKPIERFFRTVEARFCLAFDTNCGRSPAHKPEGLEDRLARGMAPKLGDFISLFSRWLDTYHHAAHRGQGMNGRSPVEVFNSSWNGHGKRTTSPHMLDLLLTRQTKDVTVHKNGVAYSGLHYGQNEPALIEWLGRKVYLRIDERDVTSVSVWTPDDRFICLAQTNQRIPANAGHELLGEAIAGKKRHRKLVRDYHVQRPRLAEDLPERMIRAAAARLPAASMTAPPENPPLKLIRSDLESEVSKLQQAKESAAQRRDPENRKSLAFLYEPACASDAEEDAEPQSAMSVILEYGTKRAGA